MTLMTRLSCNHTLWDVNFAKAVCFYRYTCFHEFSDAFEVYLFSRCCSKREKVYMPRCAQLHYVLKYYDGNLTVFPSSFITAGDVCTCHKRSFIYFKSAIVCAVMYKFTLFMCLFVDVRWRKNDNKRVCVCVCVSDFAFFLKRSYSFGNCLWLCCCWGYLYSIDILANFMEMAKWN